MFSKTFGHAVRATTYIAIHGTGGGKVGLLELSQHLELPHHFLGKIMQDLVRHGIVDSVKGPSGGFFANPETLQCKLTQLLTITDGSLVFEQCALGLKKCNPSHPCLLHHDYAVCRNGMLKILEVKTIQELVNQTEDQIVFMV